MRIALANWSNRLVGGAEQYVASIGSYLLDCGHDVAFWHETDEPAERALLPLLATIPSWDASRLGLDAAVEGLRNWRPDVIYNNGVLDLDREERLLEVAPAVYFAHNYHGTCISGGRVTLLPAAEPCLRRFGAGCLLQFYPRRCGGLNPLTMWRDFQMNRRRLELLGRYAGVVTHSNFVQQVYSSNGIGCRTVRFFVSGGDAPVVLEADRWQRSKAWRLLMMGRMTGVKGGRLLLRALPAMAEALGQDLDVTFAGDGPSRATWEQEARQVEQSDRRIRIHFTGWLNGADRSAVQQASDLLVLPSVWPEPFGMIGLEAGLCGLPTVAFAVGGIPDWLQPGVNGFLAPGTRPSVEGLTAAVVQALENENRYRSLRAGARRIALGMRVDQHYQDLLAILEQAAVRHEYAVC
jgi:glycosyltransferase involved in cell wall biosynthesis